MPPALTKTAWAKICAAAGRKPAAEAEARATLSRILYDEYPAFAYNRERVAKDIECAQQKLKQIDAFAKLYRQTFLPVSAVKPWRWKSSRRLSPRHRQKNRACSSRRRRRTLSDEDNR
jgi:hypothetical protein